MASKPAGSRAVEEYVKLLAKRAEDVRGGQVLGPRDDNMLKLSVTTGEDGARFTDCIPGMADIPLSKINVYRILRQSTIACRRTQISTDRHSAIWVH